MYVYYFAGQYKKCPRCKYILDHAEKLLHNIPKINKLDVLGICNKCWTKDRQRYSACACNEAMEKFIAITKYKEKESAESKETKYKLQKLTKPSGVIYGREPQIGQSNKPIKDFQRRRLSETIRSFAERDRTIFDKNMGYPLTRISISQESLTENYKDRSVTAHLKTAPTFNHDKDPSILDLIAEQNRNRKEYSKNETLEFKTIDTQLKLNRNGEEYMNEETRKKSNSAVSLPTSKNLSDVFPFTYLSEAKEILHKDFSYFFMKDAEKTKKSIQKLKSSSELIKDTQDMLRAREEKLVRQNEENLKLKLSYKEKSRLAREEDTSKKSFTKTQPKVDTFSIKEITKARSNKEKQYISIVDTDRKLNENVKSKKGKAEQSRKEAETREIRTKESPQKDKETKEQETEKKMKITPEQEKIDKSSSVKPKFDKEHATKDENIERHLTKSLNKEEKRQFKKEKETHEKKEEKEVPHDLKKALEKDNKESTKEKKIPPEKDKEIQEKAKEISMRNIKIEQEREDKLLIVTRDKDEQKGGIKKDKPKKGAEQEVDIKKLNSSVWKKAMEDAASKLKMLQEMDEWSDFGVEPKIYKPERKAEEPKFKELNINQIKIMKPSCDDLILQLVKIKQQDVKDKKKRVREISEIKLPRLLIEDHRDHKGFKKPTCMICNDSELELDIEEIINKDENLVDTDIIMGQKILKCKLQLTEKFDEKQAFPIYVSTLINEDFTNVPNINNDDIPVAVVHKPRSASEKYVSVPFD